MVHMHGHSMYVPMHACACEMTIGSQLWGQNVWWGWGWAEAGVILGVRVGGCPSQQRISLTTL